MAPRPSLRGFYFITDAGLSVNGLTLDVRLALLAPVALVQYREKNKPWLERLAEARAIKQLCDQARVPLIVNDDVELALEIKAAGAHVGQEDLPLASARRVLGPDAIIGVSAGNPDEARAAQDGGADYVAASPVFATATKEDAGAGMGIQGLKAIRAAVSIPLAAIGGINLQNAKDVHVAGADLLCAISASLDQGQVTENIRALMG